MKQVQKMLLIRSFGHTSFITGRSLVILFILFRGAFNELTVEINISAMGKKKLIVFYSQPKIDITK